MIWDSRPLPEGRTPRSGAVRLGPSAQLCQVQCPLRPAGFPLAPAQGSSLNRVSVWTASRSPLPWGAQIREPSLLPAAKPEAGPAWGTVGGPGRVQGDSARISQACPGRGWNQNHSPWRPIWPRVSCSCSHPLSKAALSGGELPVTEGLCKAGMASGQGQC